MKSKYLAGRLQEVLLDGTWIAQTNLQEQLNNTSWEQANSKMGNHHSLAELVFHVDYYVGGILNVFNGGDLEIRDQYSWDTEPLRSEEDWLQRVRAFVMHAQALVDKIMHTPDSQWSRPFVKEAYGTYERNIDGLIEHSYYHFGQISLLRKLLQGSAHQSPAAA
ncbi:MAG: DUF1572 domain-containing protein [Saprospiraceae bacterium]|nr:DUF1572 domain-containing protein [Saprospiraceae bacterium]